MEEIKIENESKLRGVMRDNLGKQLEKIKSQASDILIFSLQVEDLENHLKSAEEKVEKRFRELKWKEVELQNRSFALEERAKVVEAAEAQVCDLEMKADGFKKEIEVKEEELGILRKSVEECAVEQRSKESQISVLVESLRETQLEVDLKGGQLAQVESDLERHCVEVRAEKENLERTQGCRRGLEEEIERRTKVLTLVLNKTAEYAKLLETQSSELVKTQGDIELKEEQLRRIKIDLERHHGELSAVMENLDRSQAHTRELEEDVERKTKVLSLILDKNAKCVNLLETRSSELMKTEGELELKGKQLGQMKSDIERHHSELRAEMEHLETTQTRNRELDGDIERKTKDLTVVLDKVAESEKQLDSQQKLRERLSSKLVFKEKELVELILDLDLRGELVIALDNDLKKISQQMESKAQDLEEVNRLIGEGTCHYESIKLLIEEHTEELTSKEEKQNEITEALRKLNNDLKETSQQVESKAKELEEVDRLIEEQSAYSESIKLQIEERSAYYESIKLLIEEHTEELTSKEEKQNEITEAIRKLNNDFKETCQQMESKAQELKDIDRLIGERSAHYESIKLLIEEHSEELASKEKKQNEITEAIRKLSLEIASEELTLKRAKVFVEQLCKKQDSEVKKLERCVEEYDSKRNQLRSVKDKFREKEKELKSLQSRITERKKQVEEREMKMQHLDNSNEKLTRELQVKEEEVFSINKTIMECSGELESKRKHLDQVKTSITDLTSELKSKEVDLSSVKKKIQDSLKDFQSQQVRLKASLMEREQQLGEKEKELDAREKRIDNKDQQLKSAEQKLAECVKDCELKAKKLASFCQQSNTDQPVDLVRDANVCDEKTLQLTLHGHLKKCTQTHLDVSRSLKASSDPGKLALDTIQGLYSAHQRAAATNLDLNSVRRSSICLLECLMDMSSKPKTEVQGEAIKFANEWKNTTLIDAVNPVEVLGFLHFLAAFSLAYTFDADKVQNLFDVAFLRKYAPSLCEALGVSALAPVNNVLSLDDKPEQQPPEAPINNGSDSRSPDVQENIASSHLANECGLRDHEGSACFSPNEVSASLTLFNDPGRFVLSYVDDALKGADERGELGLAEPIVQALVPLLEELTCVVSRSTDPDLHSDATKVAHRWSQMMRTSGISPHEALGFLQFIVAYGLVKQTNKEQTLQFASYVAYYKQAPKLFQSLGLSYAIPNFVDKLINGRHYMLAIRFILSFNLNNNYSPLELLKEEIVNLRRSAKEKTQVEDRDAVKMRNIIELIEDFQLEIELPVDLVRKFMVPREIQNENQRAVFSSVPVQPPQMFPRFHVQASQTVTHSSFTATLGSNPSHLTSLGASLNPQVLDVDTYQAGGSTASQGRSSYYAGFKRPRVDPQGPPRSVMRPCHNPPSGYGRS